MSVHIKISKSCNAIPYTIEATLTDLEQIDVVGKVVGAIEQWIQTQFKPTVNVVFPDLPLIVEPKK